jgi:hypothetical protein
MVTDPSTSTTTHTKVNNASTNAQQEKHNHSIFDPLPSFFNYCQIFSFSYSSLAWISKPLNKSEDSTAETLDVPEKDVKATQNNVVATPTTCNTCKTKFESL